MKIRAKVQKDKKLGPQGLNCNFLKFRGENIISTTLMTNSKFQEITLVFRQISHTTLIIN